MLESEFSCELVTPMFLGNAEALPELRPPAISNAMRWWFRAMMGGIIGDNKNELKRLESIIFGNNENSSAISIRVQHERLTDNNYAPLPHKENLFKKSAFDPDQTVNIKIKLNPWIKANEQKIFNVALESLKLLLTFGGLGNRSRRGFGSLYWSNEKNEKEIIDEATAVFDSFCVLEKTAKKPWTSPPKFPCILHGYFNVFETNPPETWKDQLIKLMKQMSAFKAPSVKGKDATGWARGRSRQGSPLIVHSKKSGNNIKLILSHFLCEMEGVSEVHMNNLENFLLEKELKVTKIKIFDE